MFDVKTKLVFLDDTLKRDFRLYLEVVNDLKPKTVDETMRGYRWISTYLDGKPYNLENCLQYLALLKREGKKSSTRSTVVRYMRSLCRYLGTLGGDDFSDKLPNITVRTSIPQILSTQEICSLIDFPIRAKSDKYYNLLLSVMARTGRRVGEIVNLKVEDVSFENNLIAIKDPKNGIDRQLPIPSDLTRRISEFCKDKNGSRYIFESKSGGKLNTNNVRYILDKRRKKLGIKKSVSPHKFRHSFPIELLRQKVPLPIISELLGHVNYETTRKYIHLLTEDLRMASNLHPLNRRQLTSKDVVAQVKRVVEQYHDTSGVFVSESKDEYVVKITKS